MSTSSRTTGHGRRLLPHLLLGLFTVGATHHATAQQATGQQPTGQDAREAAAEKIERTRESLDKWVEARRTISKEQRDWVEGRAVLEERIAILTREIESVRAKIAEATASVAEADKKRLELETQSDALKSSAQRTKEIAERLEDGTRKLLQRLPQFAQERVKLFSQRIPESGVETKLSLSERFQSVVAVMNDMNKLQREITLTPEIRELSDGRAAEVATVYVGLGQGYYASADGKMAGVGAATDTAWEWSPANAQAGEIARMIAILKSEQVADFVRVPVRIR